MCYCSMEGRTRRTSVRTAAAAGLVAGGSGTTLAGCQCEDPPGEGEEHASPPGHPKDSRGSEDDPGGEAHDFDDGKHTHKPGKRHGHCRFDPQSDSDH
jgi:hypothetical protein